MAEPDTTAVASRDNVPSISVRPLAPIARLPPAVMLTLEETGAWPPIIIPVALKTLPAPVTRR